MYPVCYTRRENVVQDVTELKEELKMQTQLSFAEKRILLAYRKFFEEAYVPSDTNTDIHVQTHKMCYFLNRINCGIVDAGFVWNTFGPFSVQLQEILKQIDDKKELLQEFYDNYKAEDLLDDDIIEGIDYLKEGLEITDNRGKSRQWIELLASLSFLAHSVLPTSDFDCINDELKVRKAAFVNDAENSKAWSILERLEIAY